MRKKLPELPKIKDEEKTPIVEALLKIITLQQEQIQLQKEQIQGLRDEIARLKGLNAKPTIKPSTLEDKNPKKKDEKDKDEKKESESPPPRPGSLKRSKKDTLEIHETVFIAPDEEIPEGSDFRGYDDFTVQDILLKPHNILFRVERWEGPDGSQIVGKLPVNENFPHFGTTLVAFILYQYHHCHVTQPLLLTQLREFDIDISSGQLNRIIVENKDRYHSEKDEILRVGLEVSKYIHVDDTGARHQGKNGYCTHIGNELFAWFESTDSKSRINFLELLSAGTKNYLLNDFALSYLEDQKLSKSVLALLQTHKDESFDTRDKWNQVLEACGITKARHIQIATEGALIGSITENGWNPELVIISDDAGQFNVFVHGLCWIHAERCLAKLVGFNEKQREALEQVRLQLWDFYQVLKAYKESPAENKKEEILERFDAIFTQKFSYFQTLTGALKRLYRNKEELLLVLEHPYIPLHNNLSERDIRDYVKKRKISGSTRSKLGRMCRDTFASLKKTCSKLGISFWSYLKDRHSGKDIIPPLFEVIRQRAQEYGH